MLRQTERSVGVTLQVEHSVTLHGAGNSTGFALVNVLGGTTINLRIRGTVTTTQSGNYNLLINNGSKTQFQSPDYLSTHFPVGTHTIDKVISFRRMSVSPVSTALNFTAYLVIPYTSGTISISLESINTTITGSTYGHVTNLIDTTTLPTLNLSAGCYEVDLGGSSEIHCPIAQFMSYTTYNGTLINRYFISGSSISTPGYLNRVLQSTDWLNGRYISASGGEAGSLSLTGVKWTTGLQIDGSVII